MTYRPIISCIERSKPFLKCVKSSRGWTKLKVGFALSKWPHFYRIYLVTLRKQSSMAVSQKECPEIWLMKEVVKLEAALPLLLHMSFSKSTLLVWTCQKKMLSIDKHFFDTCKHIWVDHTSNTFLEFFGKKMTSLNPFFVQKWF